MGCDAPVCPHGRTSGPCPGCQQDYRIEDLEAEIERLRKQDSDTADMLGLAIVELAESRDEVEQLRSALKRIYGAPTVAHAMDIARAALAKETP